MQAYISISYQYRIFLENELTVIRAVLVEAGIIPFVFVDRYNFNKEQEQEMMQQAFADIDRSKLFIAEVSDKAIGIGVEAGYAKAKRLPVVYLRQAAAEHSSTVAGTSDYQVIYRDIDELRALLKLVIEKINQPLRDRFTGRGNNPLAIL